ncbi:hypothetical protein [Luteolibacter sp. LG18]|uniref:hypothetical protein n=1 Tax=Luteolibacter sp. LG18 TaxID=2819286 RepID=UPI002B2B9983|nr:hypothetical protein llg_08460 [Luteolibacter sp. LG18]
MKLRPLFLCLLACLPLARGNPNQREWKLANGETRQAEMTDYDEDRKVVTLRFKDDTVIHLDQDALSALDRAWLLEWIEAGEELEAKLTQFGGSLTRHTATGKFTTGYSVYQPPLAENAPDSTRPMLILFHPNGIGHREIYRYVEAAKATGMTLVSCEIFRNTGDNPEREAELLERFTEMLPQIEAAVPHDPKRMFMGGCSGGSWRAFHYSAQISRPWAGIYSNCGWLGGDKYYDLPYPKMRVAMVNGINDPAGMWLEPDTARLQKADCKVSVHAFEGGHQVPPPSVQEKAFRWLLSDE